METRGSISACNGFGKRIIIKKTKSHLPCWNKQDGRWFSLTF